MLRRVTPVHLLTGLACCCYGGDAIRQTSHANYRANGTETSLIVITWNIISFARSNNAFEFSGPEASSSAFNAVLEETNKAMMSDQRVEDYIGKEKMAQLETFEKKSHGEIPSLVPTAEAVAELKLRQLVNMPIKELYEMMKAKVYSRAHQGWEWRPGFNDKFTCQQRYAYVFVFNGRALKSIRQVAF
eukprot:TRINITY_DN16441_c0_g2_i2.p1 TRINITY_DN16441_c0_g2~~TRINITY_DN16441_c0_g2_i2.p1  ORF type:complete len:188 (-),score=25.37 TRINITY_DN16441_c0_g2_i2:99-662(-)